MHTHNQLNPAHTYRVIPRTLTFLYHQAEVLLLRGAPTKRLWPNQYNGIGGHIQPGEDIQKAALREIHEETGFSDIPSLTMRGVLHIPAEPAAGILIFIFTATLIRKPTARPSHEGIPEWLAWRTLPSDALVPDLPILLPYVERRMADGIFFTGTYHTDSSDALHIDLIPSN
jgi:8-oxo-dGTP diphosphatase